LEARPNLDLQLREDLTARLVEQLHAGLLDVLLIALPYEAANLHAEPILEDPFLLASPAGETNTGPVRLDELRGRRILLLQDGHCLRDHAIAACRLQPQEWSHRFGASSLH